MLWILYLKKAKDECKSQEAILITGDFNAKMVEERIYRIVVEIMAFDTKVKGDRLIE